MQKVFIIDRTMDKETILIRWDRVQKKPIRNGLDRMQKKKKYW